MDYKALVEESYAIAKSKGWWEKPRTIAALTLLMQSEIIEALEDYRAGRGVTEIWYMRSFHDEGGVKYEVVQPVPEPTDKPCGVPIELADAVIRIADFVGHYGVGLHKVAHEGPSDFEQGLAEANLHFARAYEYHRDNGTVDQNVGSLMDQAMAAIVAVCETNGINLEKAIEIKRNFNTTRSHRHGGKVI